MPTDTKQLTSDEVLERLNAIQEFSEDHTDEWRNEVARNMNHLVGRAVWWMETVRCEIDTKFGAAVLHIVERVADFDSIKKKGKPNV